MEWTEERIDLLRELFLKKWKSMNQDDEAFLEYVLNHDIVIMGLRDVRKSWKIPLELYALISDFI